MTDEKYELLKAFPPYLENDVKAVLSTITQAGKLNFSHRFKVEFYGDTLWIPERIYYNEPTLAQFMTLTDRQQIILNCLFTRHHNGFIREEKLRASIHLCNEHNWIIPYLIRLAGEYVIEILQVIKDDLGKIDKAKIKEFIAGNLEFYNTIESRVVSYWDCFYRLKYPRIEDYVGFQILAYFNS